MTAAITKRTIVTHFAATYGSRHRKALARFYIGSATTNVNMNVTGFSDDNDSSVVANRSDVNLDDSIIHAINVYFVICYVALALGIPGNILSAIVWLRGHVVSKNSSSVYLAALAIVDLVRPLFVGMLEEYSCYDGWFCRLCWGMASAAALLEPLLVLSFSVERLIAIRHPLQVCYMHRRVGQKNWTILESL